MKKFISTQAAYAAYESAQAAQVAALTEAAKHESNSPAHYAYMDACNVTEAAWSAWADAIELAEFCAVHKAEVGTANLMKAPMIQRDGKEYYSQHVPRTSGIGQWWQQSGSARADMADLARRVDSNAAYCRVGGFGWRELAQGPARYTTGLAVSHVKQPKPVTISSPAIPASFSYLDEYRASKGFKMQACAGWLDYYYRYGYMWVYLARGSVKPIPTWA